MFQTESWGFDADKITLSQEEIHIAPGTSGVIPLTVDNSGEEAEMLKLGVTISKSPMCVDEYAEHDEELQKRIYFYADTPRKYSHTYLDPNAEGGYVAETETVSKVYLGTSVPHNYVYTLLPGQILTMNDTYYSDVPIKWEWVYDMLGYYFCGTVVGAAEGTADVLEIQEYIRPIEYDYDSAVYETITEEPSEGEEEETPVTKKGNLIGFMLPDTTVEDVQTFMNRFSHADGYEGTVNMENYVDINGKYYYPVDIDENGYGVWAYLCTGEEIEEGFQYESELESIAAKATIVLTANNVQLNTCPAATANELKEALADPETEMVELTNSVSMDEFLSFGEGSKVIHLNGHTLDYAGQQDAYNLITVEEGASLMIYGGTVSGSSTAQAYGAMDKKAFDIKGGNLILSDVDVTGFDCSLYIEDMSADSPEDETDEPGDSVVQVINCNLDTKQAAMVLQGNGDATDIPTKVLVQGSTLSSTYYVGITGQGNDDRWGTELVLADSEVYGYYGGIYQPQRNSVTTITNCKIWGNTGIAIKGGTMTIYDSQIEGTGVICDPAAAAGSGFTDTGDGIYMEAVYDWTTTLVLKGTNVVLGKNMHAVELFGEEDKGPGRISIYGEGNYEGKELDVYANQIGRIEIYGGVFPNGVHENVTRYDIPAEE